jgi:hypothetical protein
MIVRVAGMAVIMFVIVSHGSGSLHAGYGWATFRRYVGPTPAIARIKGGQHEQSQKRRGQETTDDAQKQCDHTADARKGHGTSGAHKTDGCRILIGPNAVDSP